MNRVVVEAVWRLATGAHSSTLQMFAFVFIAVQHFGASTEFPLTLVSSRTTLATSHVNQTRGAVLPVVMTVVFSLKPAERCVGLSFEF